MSGRVLIPAIHVFPADNGTSREWPAFAGHDDTGEGQWRPLLALALLGLIVALVGIGLTTASTSTGTAAFITTALSGDVCLLLSSVCIAAYYVLGAELAIGQGVMVVSAWRTIFGALFLSPLALWEVGQGRVHWSFAGIGTVAYLSLLVTVLGIWIWLHGLYALPARIAASSQYVQPLIGVLASAAIFATPLGGGFALGSALVLGGIALCSLSGPHRH